jgi:hypothetical protein
MAMPVLQTSISLLISGISAARRAASSGGIALKQIANSAKAKALGAINSLLKSVFFSGLDAAKDVIAQSNSIVSQLRAGAISTAAQIDELINKASSAIAEGIASQLRRYDEQEMGVRFNPLIETVLGGAAGSLEGGLYALYAYLTPDRVASEGLRGTQDGAITAAGNAESSISSAVQSSLSTIEIGREFQEELNMADAIFDFWNEPSLWNAIVSIGRILGSVVAGGLVNGFQAGAGIGGLINVNINHHVGLLNIALGGEL